MVSPPDSHRRLPLMLLLVLGVVCALSVALAPAGAFSWALEVVPGLLLVLFLAGSYRRLPTTRWVYWATFVHVLILNYGGIYTYAKTPLGDWLKTTFALSRNPYDRVGHVALGLLPVFFAREVLLHKTPLRGGWLAFLTWCVLFSVGAFWELIEWWGTLLLASEQGQAFLGTQGDIWDAQWDMFLVGVGAFVGLLCSRWHDRSIASHRTS